MSEPRWNDSNLKAGTMVRGALWLIQVVGEGSIFTKDQVREAFPKIAQADRRIRDLRKHGWVISTNTEDATLGINEQRFVAPGARIWEKGVRRTAGGKGLSPRERASMLADANYQCQRCGVAAGQQYPDDSTLSAVLLVSKLEGISATVICKRCHSGRTTQTKSSSTDIWRHLTSMSSAEKAQLRSWIQRNRRGVTATDRAWRAFNDLEESEQTRVKSYLDDLRDLEQ